MEITLYHSPGACSMATYISLLEAGADFNVKITSLKNKDHLQPEYAALNPKKKVPYIAIDGKGLTENVAIQSWIAETYPDAKLFPADSWDQKRALSYMGWFGSGIHPHITRHFKPGFFCGNTDAHDDMKIKAKAKYMEQMELIESELEGKTWFFDHYTVCDSYYFWIYVRAEQEGFDLSGLVHGTAHNKRMLERESVQKVLAHTAD
ncbi:MAG: glutathione S-transferase N-terminal domain-containing protein [Gammaproteobacteria bacterium]|nr:glutathione S-transferase N-terminal domain-containing protein [Gammaproteobacteria bacterium]